MRIGVDFPWDGGNDIVLLYHAGKFEMRAYTGWRDRSLALVMIRF